jgi:PAS domain S-box-containing protein
MQPPANLRFLDAPGDVARLMREHDWSDSPLGPPDAWPQSLRSVVSLLLRSQFPMFVAWGPSLGFLYNDPYAEILGSKHPAAIGRPFKEIWSEIWDDIRDLVDRAMAGEASFMENLPLTMLRNGYEEATWFTFSYSPVVDEQGDVAGMYCACTETTSNMLAERMRSAESNRLMSMFEQAPGLFAVTRGRSHVYEIANPAYFDFVGRNTILGLSVRDALPELDQRFIDTLTEVFDTGVPYLGRRIPIGLKRGDRMEDRIVDFVFQPIVDDEGRVDGIFIQGTDITEQAVAELDAQIERRRLDAIVESLPSGVVIANAAGALVRVNAANREIWGEHPMSASVSEYGTWQGWWADGAAHHGEPVASDEWALARALRGEVVRGDVVEVQPFGGRPRRILLMQAMPIRIEDAGAITGAVLAQTDISDRVQAEADLRASEARFRTMTDAMPQMVWSALPDGYHDYFNRQWYDYTGLPAGTTDGEKWAGVFHPQDQDEAWARWRHSLATGDDYEIHYRLRHHSGQYRWVLGRAVPVRDASGAIIRWLGTCTDIHEQRVAQDALEKSERALRETGRRKDEFLAMLAHELRNPLAPISTASQLLMLNPDPARVRVASEVITRQVRHMTELVDDLLDVSRVTRGLVHLEMDDVDLKETIVGAIEQVRPLIDARKHALRTRMTAAPIWVRGDRTRLTQVFANILNNAAKYTPEAGDLGVEIDLEDSLVVVRIRDNGQGIEAPLLPHIFELFTQAERTPDRAQGGLGIGLALVWSLVNLHGGSITADSEGAGHGSTFTVQLPAITPAVAREAAPAAARADNGALDIVVVDDNVDAARTLQGLLEALGHRVRIFHRALDALEAISERPPAVAFLDIGLPDITGYELAKRIRARLGERGCVLSALSGYGQPQDVAASRLAGMDFHLIKPLDYARLREVLDGVPRQPSPRSD